MAGAYPTLLLVAALSLQLVNVLGELCLPSHSDPDIPGLPHSSVMSWHPEVRCWRKLRLVAPLSLSLSPPCIDSAFARRSPYMVVDEGR